MNDTDLSEKLSHISSLIASSRLKIKAINSSLDEEKTILLGLLEEASELEKILLKIKMDRWHHR